jgi:hypothetical protein
MSTPMNDDTRTTDPELVRQTEEPTPEEERAAERNELDPEVARNNKEAIERGANVKGEGQIEP